VTEHAEVTHLPSNASEDRRSVLGNLKARREQIFQGEVLDLPVPRWRDPQIHVQYKPVEHSTIRAGQTRMEKAPKNRRYQVEVEANCDLLIKGCVAVYARLEGDSSRYSLRPDDWEGDPTTFDPDLAENLGLPESATARDVVRELFMTEGDILSHAQQLIEFSGYRETEADESVEGE
jgi:hypothetical protein